MFAALRATNTRKCAAKNDDHRQISLAESRDQIGSVSIASTRSMLNTNLRCAFRTFRCRTARADS
jgi:hypothetical protein